MDLKLVAFALERWASAFVRRKKNAVFTVLTCLLLFLIMTKTNHARRRKPIPIAPMIPVKAEPKEPNEGPPDAKERVKRIVLNKENQHPLHVRKQLSELESIYYYDDGRPKHLKANHTLAQFDEDLMMGQDSDEGQAKLIAEKHFKNPEIGYQKKYKCDNNGLHVNDTNVERDLDPCSFRNISGDPEIDRKINNLEPLDVNLLMNYRNPCWYEKLPEVNEYKNKIHMFWWQVKESFDRLWPIMEERRKQNHMWRLRCLPMIYIIGLSHCGAADLLNILLGHHFIVKGATREPFYWDRNRWFLNSRFSNYLDLFDEAAEKIRKTYTDRTFKGTLRTYHPMLTLDGSVHYLTDFLGINHLPSNANKKEPVHLLPSVIRNLTPNRDITIIVAIRNPTDRLFVSYAGYDSQKEKAKSPEEFHQLASEHIERIQKCTVTSSLRVCLYDKTVTKTQRKVNVHVGIYNGYIRDWIHVFPAMKVVRWEDFRTNRSGVYKEVISELGLYLDTNSIPSDNAKEVDPDPGFTMLDKTRDMLDKFYRPYNDKLAILLKDDKFAFR